MSTGTKCTSALTWRLVLAALGAAATAAAAVIVQIAITNDSDSQNADID